MKGRNVARQRCSGGRQELLGGRHQTDTWQEVTSSQRGPSGHPGAEGVGRAADRHRGVAETDARDKPEE